MGKKNKARIAGNRARKKQRAAAKKKRRRKAQAPGGAGYDGFSHRAIREAPIHEVHIPKGLFTLGVGHVVVSRVVAPGMFAVGVFLVDVFCTGVKDSFLAVVDREDYEEMRNKLDRQAGNDANASPAYARKLIDEVTVYAEGLGFRPHGKFSRACWVLEAIDPAECDATFEFGQDGKPLYVSGPYDSPSVIDRTRRKLEHACGPDGYEFIIPMPESDWDDFDRFEDEEEWGEEDDWQYEVDEDESDDGWMHDVESTPSRGAPAPPAATPRKRHPLACIRNIFGKSDR
jgi:hypothetical protein